MKKYFAYIRVSTVKQGEHGSSLQEQRDAISAFASRNGFHIEAWFEERETAAKLGRREFTRMLSALRHRKATGVIFHKIDRSARNLRDWSVIQDLADDGIDVRFTQESVNLGSNEGKLTGDFLAVISAHYIRNLREEVKKGIRGRLKQGLYPLGAPIGYLNQGGGKPKIPDPQRASLVHEAFELYATGDYSLRVLSDHLYEMGFRDLKGRKVLTNRLSDILRNPFYVGIMRLKRSGESFPGIHLPLVSAKLFADVQARLDGKRNAKLIRHEFQFRRLVRCASCGYAVTAERQKGHVYYRCHNCRGTSAREETIQSALDAIVRPLLLTEDEQAELRQIARDSATMWDSERSQMMQSLHLQLEAVGARIERLANMFMDGAVDKGFYDEKRFDLLLERGRLEEHIRSLEGGNNPIAHRLEEYFELLKNLPLSLKLASPQEKRALLESLTSNFCLDGKNVVVELKSPFLELATTETVRSGGPVRGRVRTRPARFFAFLAKYAEQISEEKKARAEIALAA